MNRGRGKRTVRALRLDLGLTIDELALRAGVASNTIRRLERGERAPTFGRTAERRVAGALGSKVEAIAWGEVESGGTPDLLRTLRVERGWHSHDVAIRSGVPLRTIKRAEEGVAVHPRAAKALADLYGVRVADFYPPDRRAAAA